MENSHVCAICGVTTKNRKWEMKIVAETNGLSGITSPSILALLFQLRLCVVT